MLEETKWGFSKGIVAKQIREYLYPGLSNADVDSIAVVLFTHLMVESSINSVLFWSIIHYLPSYDDGDIAEKMKTKIWEKIIEKGFASKYKLLYLYLAEFNQKEAKDIWEINNVRNALFHKGDIEKLKYYDEPILKEEVLEKMYINTDFAAKELEDCIDYINNREFLKEYALKFIQEIS